MCARRNMAVACGPFCTFVVAEAGQVLVSGDGDIDQFADVYGEHRRGMMRLEGDFSARMVIVSAGWSHSALLDSDGELWMSGNGKHGQLGTGGRGAKLPPTRVPKKRFGGARVKMAACGNFHTLVLTEAGSVWAFGLGCYGRLGTGDEDDRTEPTGAGAGERSR